MTERTLQQALEHAEDMRKKQMSAAGRRLLEAGAVGFPLFDIVVLASEVHRLQKEVDGLKSGAFNAGVTFSEGDLP